MSFLKFFRKKKEDESSRIARLSKTGRITEGVSLDLISDRSDGTQVCYTYEIAGVQYESSQQLTDQQLQHLDDYSPGAHIIIRYDPRQHANSVVI